MKTRHNAGPESHDDNKPTLRTDPEWYVRSVAGFYHLLDRKIRSGLKDLLGKPRPKERPKLPTTQILIIMAIIVAAIVISYNGPHYVGSTFWIGGLSLNTVVAGGFLAFAPWLQERSPDIMIAMVEEAVNAGLAKWGDGLTAEGARDLFRTLTLSNRVWMSVSMTASGLIMLTLNLTAFPVMVWLPNATRIGVTTALVALMVNVVVSVAFGLSIVRAWPVVWKFYGALKDEHATFNPCPLCSFNNSEHPPESEILTITQLQRTSSLSQ